MTKSEREYEHMKVELSSLKLRIEMQAFEGHDPAMADNCNFREIERK